MHFLYKEEKFGLENYAFQDSTSWMENGKDGLHADEEDQRVRSTKKAKMDGEVLEEFVVKIVLCISKE